MPLPPVQILPPIRACNPGDIQPWGMTWDPVHCRWVPNPTSLLPIYSGGGSGTGSTPAQTAGTPVPAGFSQNQLFVASDGSQWMFSSSQNKWISVGTPYNPNQPGAIGPAPVSSAGTYPNSPVPSTWPTNQAFTDSSGNLWVYNPGYGTFQLQSSIAAGAAATPSTTTVVTPAATSGYQSILDWLSQSSLIPNVPNWIVAAGVGLLAMKFMQPAGARR